MPTALTRLSESNLVYLKWEKRFFDQESPATFQALQELTRLAPGEERTFYAAALTSYLDDQLPEASRYLNAIPPSSEYFTKATTIRGLIAMGEGDDAKASNIAKHAVNATPEDPMAWMLAAEVAMFLAGNPRQSVEFIRKAVALGPDKYLFRSSEVLLLAHLPDQKAAFEAAIKGESDFPGNEFFTIWIANHLDRTGRTTEAVAKARLAVESSGGSPKSRIVLARLLAKSTEPADQSESRKMRTDLLHGAGDDPDQIRELVDTAESAGDPAMAHELLARAALKCPRADLLADLAFVRMEEGKFDEARLHLETALRLDPKSSKAMEVRWILEGENLDESIREWAKEALPK